MEDHAMNAIVILDVIIALTTIFVLSGRLHLPYGVVLTALAAVTLGMVFRTQMSDTFMSGLVHGYFILTSTGMVALIIKHAICGVDAPKKE